MTTFLHRLYKVFISFIRCNRSNQRSEAGQVMLLTVLVLSGTILGATTIAGLLTLYQIRQTGDFINSSKAIFAADTGIEWRLYKFFKEDGQECNPDCEGIGSGDCLPPAMTNISSPSAPIKTSCDTAIGETGTVITIKSTGISNRSSRAFEITLQ